ncbi:acyltransferase ChoActase/COT/CPT [Phlebopus sp. FC_14]|nr:acyltransferase ChoActase/COT/CPT [Phlebopus sp. FC_14]
MSTSSFLPSARPANWKSLAPAIPNVVHQPTSLPRLPVPALAATLDRLKASLSPLARTPEEYAATCAKIDQFASDRGVGRALQAKLEERKNHTDHWLEQWWDDLGYLAYRDSVVVNVSYYYGFEPQPPHLPQTPAARAAAITRGAMLFRQKLRTGHLPLDTTKETEFCMDTYRWMFDCSRVPGSAGIDWSVSHAANPNPDDLGHIIVVRKNRFWKLKAEVGGRVLGMEELIRQFQCIYENSADEYPAIGALSASDRDTWAKDFALLSSHPLNASHLSTIHSSAFLVSLDDSDPPPRNEVDVSRGLWHGTLAVCLSIRTETSRHVRARALSSRYTDKPLQFIVFDNGVTGLMGEHSIMDGTPTARACDEVLEWISSPTSDFQLEVPPSTFSDAPSIPPPVPLDFDLTPIPAIHESISSAVTRAEALARSQSLSFLHTPYGKRAIKAFGVGPDGWAQVVIQIAYARLARGGKVPQWPVGTYEAATTRRFYKGRTETIRVVSDEVVRFVKAMLDGAATREEKLVLFKRAVKKHGQLAREAGMAEGVDRHMLGLKVVGGASQPLPALFTDPLYTRSSHWNLSTSAIFSKHFTVYGWGEVVPDGFGVAYVTGFDGASLVSFLTLISCNPSRITCSWFILFILCEDALWKCSCVLTSTDYLQFTITSRTEMPNAEFTEEIARAAEDLYELFAGVKPAPSANEGANAMKARL